MRATRVFMLPLLLATLAPARLAAQRVSEIQIAPPHMRIVQDAQAQLVATAYDSNGAPVNTRIRWSSSNINIATISADGTVRAITPGTVLMTATAEQEGRRVQTRATVYVLRPRPEPRTVFIPAEPPAASAPSASSPAPAPAPGGVPFPPRGGMTMVRMDSAMRASINCNEPFLNAANPMRACYDSAATLRDSSFVVPERPARDRCPQGAPAITLLVQVNEYGRVDGVMPFASTQCGEFTRAVIDAARRAVFTPAEQNGKPIRAWVRLHVRGEEGLR